MEPRPEYVNVHEAKTSLSKLLVRVEAGEEIVLARGGKPIARIVPIRKPKLADAFGMLSHLPPLPDDFLDPDPEIEEMFGMH